MNLFWTDKPRQKRGAVFFLILLPLALYAPSLSSSFVYDDNRFIAENQAITSLAKIPNFFSDPSTACAEGAWEGIYRPLRTLSFAVDYFFFGKNPWGYHLHSLLLHLLNVFLVYSLFSLLFRDKTPALLPALLFGIHPMQVESVAWLSSRDVLLCLLFFLLSFHSFFSSWKKRWLVWPGLLFFFLSILSRESGLALPALLLGCEILPSIRTRASRRRWPLWIYIPLLLLSAGYLLLRLHLLGEGFFQRGPWGEGVLPHFQYVSKGFSTYLLWFLFPANFHFDFQVPSPAGWQDVLAAAGFFSALFLLLALCFSRKRGALPFGILWFLATLLPTSNLVVALNILAADRFLHLSMPGLLLLLTLPFRRLYHFPSFRILRILVLILLVCSFSCFTARNVSDFRNPDSLWKAALSVSPESFRAQHGMAAAFLKKGRYEAAEAHLKRAIALHESYFPAHRDLGMLYLLLSQKQAAQGEKTEDLSLFGTPFSLRAVGFFHLRKALSLMKKEPHHQKHKDYWMVKRLLEEE